MRLATIAGILCGLLLIAIEAFARKAWWILIPYALLISVVAVWGKGRFGRVFASLLIASAILYTYVAATADPSISTIGHVWRVAALAGAAAICSAVAAVVPRVVRQ